MILAKETVARQQIARRVVLLPQRLRGRHADQPAELVFRDDPDRRAFRTQLFGALELVALRRFGRGAKPFGADDEHRRPCIYIVGGLTAEASDERTGVPPAERTEFSGKDDELAGKREPRRSSRAGVLE